MEEMHATLAQLTPTHKLTDAQATELSIILATAQAKYPDRADVLSRANVVLVDGRLFPSPDAQTATVLAPDGLRAYAVRQTCDCDTTWKVIAPHGTIEEDGG